MHLISFPPPILLFSTSSLPPYTLLSLLFPLLTSFLLLPFLSSPRLPPLLPVSSPSLSSSPSLFSSPLFSQSPPSLSPLHLLFPPPLFMCHVQQEYNHIRNFLHGERVQQHLIYHSHVHRHAHSVIKTISPFIQNHPAKLTSLTWTERLDLHSTPLLDTCHQAEESLINCQAAYRTMDELHRIQHEIPSQR